MKYAIEKGEYTLTYTSLSKVPAGIIPIFYFMLYFHCKEFKTKNTVFKILS